MSPSARPVNRMRTGARSTESRALLEEGRDVEVVVAAAVAEVELVVVGTAEHVVLGGLEPKGAAPLAAARLALVPSVEAGGDDRDPHLVAHGVVDDGTEDDVGVGMGHAADDLGRLVDLEEAEVAAARDVEQDAACALDGRLEEGAGDRGASGVQGPALARRVSDAHQ